MKYPDRYARLKAWRKSVENKDYATYVYVIEGIPCPVLMPKEEVAEIKARATRRREFEKAPLRSLIKSMFT